VLPAADQAARQQPGRSRLADRQPYGRHASSPAAGTSWTAGARHRRPARRRVMAARKYWT
jgi:hypothetical protein